MKKTINEIAGALTGGQLKICDNAVFPKEKTEKKSGMIKFIE